jgi:osmotically-inducible protein OsmY
MFTRNTLAALAASVALITMTGCAVTRDQSTVGAYIDDTAITTSVKARLSTTRKSMPRRSASETLNGTVMSGFAKNSTESPEEITRREGREIGQERNRLRG